MSKTRFIVLKLIANDCMDKQGTFTWKPSVLISDYQWWCANETEIVAWMKDNLAQGVTSQKGSIVEFADRDEMVLFLLTWQGS